jgi:hypothetical protein
MNKYLRMHIKKATPKQNVNLFGYTVLQFLGFFMFIVFMIFLLVIL